MKKSNRKIFKEIMQLRKEKKLKQAFDKYQKFDAKNAIEKEWAEKALSWIYYDLLKSLIEDKNYPKLKSMLDEIKDKSFFKDGDDLFTDAVWKKIAFTFMNICKEAKDNSDYSEVDVFYQFIKSEMNPTQCDGFSILLNAALRVDEEWDLFPDFIKWWDLKHLQEGDYKMREAKNGKSRFISLGEQALLSYSKFLLNKVKEKSNTDIGYQTDLKEIKDLAILIEKAIDSGIEQKWLNYALAKLLLKIDEDKHGLEEFIPFALKNTDKFWVWSTLAEFFHELKEEEKSFNAYCKAFDLEAPDKFMVNVREKFIHLLLKKGEYDWAKTELDDLIETRESENWSVDMELDMLLCSDWYQNATNLQDHVVDQKYDKPAEKAEDELYQYANKMTGHIEWIDTRQNKAGIRIDEKLFSVFRSQKRLSKYKVGQFVEVKGIKERGKLYILSIRKVGIPKNQNWLINYQGEVSFSNHNKTAFVFDEERFISILVPKEIINNKVQNGDTVKGKALKKWNTIKNKWDYQAIEI